MVVLDCGLFGVDGRWARSLVGVIVQALTITARQQIVADLEVAADVPVVYLPTPSTIASTLFDFSHTETARDRGVRRDRASCWPRWPCTASRSRPGLYGDPPVALHSPSVADLVRW